MSNDAEMLANQLASANPGSLLEILQQHARNNGAHLSRITVGGLMVRWARVYDHRGDIKKTLWLAQSLTTSYHHVIGGYFAAMAELMRSQELFEASAIIFPNLKAEGLLTHMKESGLKADAFIAYQPTVRGHIATFFPNAEVLTPQVSGPRSATALAEVYKPLPVAYSAINSNRRAFHRNEG